MDPLKTDAKADIDLLGRMRAGDEAAFTLVVSRYHSRLVRLANSFVDRRDIAEDVAQETWIGVLRGVDTFEGRSSFRTWLFQICANRARSAVQREGRVVPVEPGTDTVLERFSPTGAWISPPQEWAHSIADRVDDADLLKAVQRGILSLPNKQRQVVTLRDVEGLSAMEVCEVLAITESNQRVLLHRGRSQVRASLDQLARQP